jgi:hypothetical protein
METICLHQFIRPKSEVSLSDGSGNCSKCIKDEKNKNCSRFYPIKIKTFDVERKK